MSTVNDPVQLVADPRCPEMQRELLRLGTDIAPPRDAEARVWLALGGALGAAWAGGAAADASTKTASTTAGTTAKTTTGTTTGTTTTTAAKTGLVSLKVVALTAGLTVLVALGSWILGPTRQARPPAPGAPAPTVETPARAPAPQSLPAVEPPPETPPPAGDEPARPAPAHRSFRSPARRLGEETTLIRGARQALRGGDAARALRLLEESRHLFPSGVLQQERERLTIEALIKDGRRNEASARAAAFLRKYPDSPHAAEIRARGLGAPERR